MAQPVWETPAGSLGTRPEGVFFSVPLVAAVPDPSDEVYYQVIAGNLPSGVQCASGQLSGTPRAIADVEGVPLPVSGEVTSKFVVRAYTEKEISPGIKVINRLADRTFTITITGQNAPEFTTPPGSLGTFFDGTLISNLKVEYTDSDPTAIVVVKLVAGSLPNGLTISSTGVISGYTLPPADGSTDNIDYQFVLEVTNGHASNLRTFSILVDNRENLTADTTLFTADNTFITADGSPNVPPSLLNPEGTIATIRSDNFYAYQFKGIDLSGDAIRYHLIVNGSTLEVPPGLVLDSNTGWLYGYIPNLGLTELGYRFGITVSMANNPYNVSTVYYYNINVVGAIDNDVTWISPSNLGVINTGSVSIFSVNAVTRSRLPLEYRLKSGSASSLPQGLSLLPSGNIAGRVSFNCFALDGNTTTFDVNLQKLALTGINTATTFDRTFNFTVEAYSNNNFIDVYKDFTITIARAYDAPYENLYIQAMPPESNRALVNRLLGNQEIIPQDVLYRPDDPNFGKATNVTYWHAYGLTSATLSEYVSALVENHYWKNVVLGNIKTAQALDDSGNIIYEVVYSEVIDDLVNAQGESVSKSLPLPYPVVNDNGETTSIVYPNSLINMRKQVIDTVGQISNILPRWMLSKQASGRVLGFTPAWVIAYTKPGGSGKIAYNIQQQFGEQLNKVDFKIDRYELDHLLSIHWDPNSQSWTPTPAETTFDITPGPQTVFDGNAMKFIDPVDMYTDNTTDFNEYLLFPKKNILENLPFVNGYPVTWINDSNVPVGWKNNTNLPVEWTHLYP